MMPKKIQTPNVTHKENLIRISTDLPMEIFKPRRSWINAFQVLKDHNCQTTLKYLTKLFNLVEEEKMFPMIQTDKKKLCIRQKPKENTGNNNTKLKG